MRRLLLALVAPCIHAAAAPAAFVPPSVEDDLAAGSKRFEDVLSDLLNEFSYDLKTTQLQGKKTMSIRKVSLSDNVPKSYETYLASLLTERIQKYSSIRLLECPACRIKRAVVENNQMVVRAPVSDVSELDKVAEGQGIESWMDASLLYQPGNLVLTVTAFDSRTKEFLFSRVYSSDTIYKKNVKREVVGGKLQETPQNEPAYVWNLGLNWTSLANVKTNSTMLGGDLRVAESFRKGRSEVGGQVSVLVNTSVVSASYPGASTVVFSASDGSGGTTTASVNPVLYALGVFGTYHEHVFGNVDDRDGFRGGWQGALGAVIATGYFSPSLRGGLHLLLGQHFYLEGNLLYSLPATLTIEKIYTYRTPGGLGSGLTFGLVY